MAKDDIRPRKTCEVECTGCGWSFWLDALDHALFAPVCATCKYGDRELPKALGAKENG